MFNTARFKAFAIIGAVLITLAGCSDTSTLSWIRLSKVTDSTSLEKAIELNDKSTSLVGEGLVHYRKLLASKSANTQERAKLLYSRVQMHANSSIMYASDFNQVAELELLHLGWAKSLTPPYTQIMDNRIRAFDTSAAIFRTSPLMRPSGNSISTTRFIYYPAIDEAVSHLNALCLVATNPWSMDPEQGVVPQLVDRVQKMSVEFMDKMQDVTVDFGRNYTGMPFHKSEYANKLNQMCQPKQMQTPPASPKE